MARPPGLLYSINETPPSTVLVISAIQHVAVNAITLVFPLIIAHEAGLVGDSLINFVSVSMLALGLATTLLCMRSHVIGSGYLCPAGYSQIYIGLSLFALEHGGIALVFGTRKFTCITTIEVESNRHPTDGKLKCRPMARQPVKALQ